MLMFSNISTLQFGFTRPNEEVCLALFLNYVKSQCIFKGGRCNLALKLHAFVSPSGEVQVKLNRIISQMPVLKFKHQRNK